MTQYHISDRTFDDNTTLVTGHLMTQYHISDTTFDDTMPH
jgi:hypothetical protein